MYYHILHSTFSRACGNFVCPWNRPKCLECETDLHLPVLLTNCRWSPLPIAITCSLHFTHWQVKKHLIPRNPKRRQMGNKKDSFSETILWFFTASSFWLWQSGTSKHEQVKNKVLRPVIYRFTCKCFICHKWQQMKTELLRCIVFRRLQRGDNITTTYYCSCVRLFFRPDQSGMSKVEAAVNTLRLVLNHYISSFELASIGIAGRQLLVYLEYI